jgi:TRAP-type transport system periplasmic protein
MTLTRRSVSLGALALAMSAGFAPAALAQDRITLRMSTPASETDQRSWRWPRSSRPPSRNSRTTSRITTPRCGAGLGARGHRVGRSRDVDHLGAGTRDLLPRILDLRHRLCPPGRRASGGGVQRPVMDPFKQKVEDELGVKLLAVMYLGQRHVNLRSAPVERTSRRPRTSAGVNLRMPGTDAWQFLGRALGANPTPMAFTEIYTALQTGFGRRAGQPAADRGGRQVLRGDQPDRADQHLVDLNYRRLLEVGLGQPQPRAAGDRAGGGGRCRRIRAAGAACQGGRARLVPARAGSRRLRARPRGVPRAWCRRNMSPRTSRPPGPRACSTRSTNSASEPCTGGPGHRPPDVGMVGVLAQMATGLRRLSEAVAALFMALHLPDLHPADRGALRRAARRADRGVPILEPSALRLDAGILPRALGLADLLGLRLRGARRIT